MKVLSNEESSDSHRPPQLVVPLSSIPPEEVNAALDETPKKKGKKTTTKVVGEFSISYEVPRICIQNIDLDNSLLYDESSSDAIKDRQLSFIERLRNWTLQQRERSDGKMRDVYYNHTKSGSSFRSMKEVVKFMIYEKHPSRALHTKKDN